MSDEFEPVRLEGPKPDEIHVISSVTAALGFMYALWPGHTGEKKELAEQACRQALAGDISPAKARQAFYEAAAEADLLEERDGN